MIEGEPVRVARRSTSLLLLLVLAITLSAVGPSAVPADAAGKATVVKLPGGGELIVPKTSLTPGAKIVISRAFPPKGGKPFRSITKPFRLSVAHGKLVGRVRLEIPLPKDMTRQKASSLTWTTWSKTQGWYSVPVRLDWKHRLLVASIDHFSWWNPASWDWTGLFADVTQGLGQLVGSRSGPAVCSGAEPSWVSSVVGLTNGADIAVHGCDQSQGDVLEVQLVNNRSYGMMVTYGGPVVWGWHEAGSSALSLGRNALVDHLVGSDELYLPPGGRASLGITRPSQPETFHIGVDGLTVLADAAYDVFGPIAGLIPQVGECVGYSLGVSPFKLDTLSGLRDAYASAGQCLLQGYKDLVAAGKLDQHTVDELGDTLKQVKVANVVAVAWIVAGITWQVADLVADSVASNVQGLGYGYAVYPKAVVTTTPSPPSTAPITPPQPTPSLPAPQPSQPAQNPPAATRVDAYSNYGEPAAGHAMCRGNPANGLSMPGGSAAESFSVPSGVASIDTALVQIDPDASVTAHASLSVNGSPRATADAAASGDTQFNFSSVGVSAGDTVTLTISFTATYGKIITVYTVGSPGGNFSASNSCPAGAPSVAPTSDGLRAVVSGWSA